MDRIPVYILAGGRSRRFGSDKARALLSGKPLILHVADALRPFASSVTAVADVSAKYDDLGMHTIGDLYPHLGPLGGLSTALNHCTDPWLLLAPCDFPEIKPEWIETLLEHREQGNEAVAYKGNHWQPMPALYGRSILAGIQDRLNSSDRSLSSLLDHSRVRAIPLPADWPARSGVNDARELDTISTGTQV